MKEKLIQQIQNYIPACEQEETDKATLLSWLASGDDISVRDNLVGHLTASAWVVNPERTHVLMAYHKLYDSWAWLGGHADGCTDLVSVAVKEACEEAGLGADEVHPVSREVLSLEVLPVSGHVKKGKWVPSHLHYNVTYLLEASEEAVLKVNEEENTDVAWFALEDVQRASKEPWFVEHIYSKLIAKMNR